MAALAEAAQISLRWLITGEGGMETSADTAAPPTPRTPQPPPPPTTDAELLAVLMDGISKTYKDVSARISPADMGRLAARHHDQICLATDSPDGRRFMAQLVFVQLRADLTAPTENASSKRLA